MKSIIILIFISFLLAGCRKISDPVSVNRYDPESEYFTGNPAEGLNIQTLSRNSVKLTWRDSSSFETGYKIERTDLSSGETLTFTTAKDVISYLDGDLNIKDVYRYRIGVLTGSKVFKYTDSLTISYSPYPEIVKTPFGGAVQLSRDSKRCITSSPTSEYEPEVINIYEINGSNFTLIRTKTLYPRSAYKYQLSGNGRYIAFAGHNRYGYYDIENDKIVAFDHTFEEYHLGVSPDSRFILVGRESNRLVLLNVETNTQQTLNINVGYWFDQLPIVMSPDNRYAVCSSTHDIYIYDVTENTLHSHFVLPSGGHKVIMDFNDNSDVFFFYGYYFSSTEPLRFLNLKTKEVFLSKSVPVIETMKYISNSQFIIGSKENRLFLWKIEDNMPSYEIPVYLPNNMVFDSWRIVVGESGDIIVLPSIINESNAFLIRFGENWHAVK